MRLLRKFILIYIELRLCISWHIIRCKRRPVWGKIQRNSKRGKDSKHRKDEKSKNKNTRIVLNEMFFFRERSCVNLKDDVTIYFALFAYFTNTDAHFLLHFFPRETRILKRRSRKKMCAVKLFKLSSTTSLSISREKIKYIIAPRFLQVSVGHEFSAERRPLSMCW